mgnify:CR=1 FL=1
MENRKENREEMAVFQERTSRILGFIIAGKNVCVFKGELQLS